MKAEPLVQPRVRAMPPFGARFSVGEAVGDVLQDRGVLGQQGAVIQPDRRHHAERVQAENKSEPSSTMRLVFGSTSMKPALRTGLVECNAGGERTGERREIKVHRGSPRVDFCTVPHEISGVKDNFRDGTKTIARP